MAVPDFQTLMRPLLAILGDGQDHAIKAIRADLAEHFSLSEADLEEMIPSGRVTTFQNRVGWAATYLYRTKLIERPRRAVYRITDRGREVLDEHPDRVDLKVLARFDEFEEFRQKTAEEHRRHRRQCAADGEGRRKRGHAGGAHRQRRSRATRSAGGGTPGSCLRSVAGVLRAARARRPA